MTRPLNPTSAHVGENVSQLSVELRLSTIHALPRFLLKNPLQLVDVL